MYLLMFLTLSAVAGMLISQGSILVSTKPISLVPDVIGKWGYLSCMSVLSPSRAPTSLSAGCRLLSLPAVCGSPCSVRNGFLFSDDQPQVPPWL